MTTNALKSTIIKNISALEDVKLLKEIQSILAKSKKEKEVNVPSEKAKEISVARDQLKNGNSYSQESVEQHFLKWKS
jgi:hypothetical protein